MRLKKLEIHGFKSFADKVEMSFEDGVTGVVGPNGSGKSNISDAIRWVLGEQSAKQLRGSKMEDVIFNGTEKRRKQSFCEVALTFDNIDGTLPVAYTEVTVARRVYRTGESEYIINGQSARLKDVTDLFRDTGIGRDGYSIIGQGRVDEILSQKSEDRRQVFEEAAGIMKYKTRKNEAERRIENTRDNLARINDIIFELESRIDPLKAQSEQAREYLALRDELKGLEINQFIVRSERYQVRLKELSESVELEKGRLAELEKTHEGLLSDRAACEDELGRLETETAVLREEVQERIRETEALEGRLGVLRERIANSARERKRVTAEWQAASEGRSGIEKRIAEMGESIAVSQTEAEALEEAVTAEDMVLTKDEAALGAYEAETEAMKEELIAWMNRIGDVRSEQARLNAMKGLIGQQLEKFGENRERMTESGGIVEEALAEAERENEEEHRLKDELQEKTKACDDKVRAASDRSDKLASDMRTVQTELQAASQRLSLLSEMQREYEGYNQSVKQVLMQAARIPQSGVHGVVANIIKVPRELERAVDMVLGAAVQNIVVDRDEDAKRMIDYLRKNRFGRATFLPIGSVRGRTLDAREREFLKMPGCVGLASELVSFDKRYQGIVDNLLGRTVVAENLEYGIAIQRAGRYQFRLVTLEGDVMHSGGSMTGGSTQSRMTSLLSREREIKELTEEKTRLEKALEKAKTDLAATEAERRDLKAERADLFEQLHQQDIACARSEAHLKRARDDKEAFDTQNADLDGEVSRLTEQLSDIEQRLSVLDRDVQSESQDSDASKQAVAERQRRIVTDRRALEERREALTARKVDLAARTRGLQAEKADRDRLVGQLNDTERLFSEAQAQLAKMDETDRAESAEFDDTEGTLNEMRGELNRARDAFNSGDALRVGAQERLSSISDETEAARVQSEQASERLHRFEMQFSRIDGEFRQMTDRVWEDYELTYEGALPMRDEAFKLGEAEKRIAAIRLTIRGMGTVNVAAVDEYRTTLERYEDLSKQRGDLMKAEEDLMKIIDDLTRTMERQFVEQFTLLNDNFKITFAALFGGGQAELRLADPKDALNCGIEIAVQPPGKKLQLLSLLSGGERALTAIAILFAMLRLKPTPFCFLDEIEAALDDANIDNFADYLKEYSKKTQFIVITHRKGTMERCDALYGVAMQEKGVSRMVSVKLGDIA